MSAQDPHVQLLIRIIAAASQSGNTDELLSQLAQMLKDGLGLRECWIGLVDPISNTLERRAGTGTNLAADANPQRLPLEASSSDPLVQAVLANRMLALPLDDGDGPFAQDQPASIPRRAYLAYVPISGPAGALGVIQIVSDESRPLTETGLLVAEACAQQIAMHIEGARLLEGSRRQARRWAGVAAACKALHRNLSLPQVFEAIAQGIVEALGFRMAAINVREGSVFRVTSVVGPPDAVQKLSGLRVPWATWAELMQEQHRISRSYLILHDCMNWEQTALSPYLYRPHLPERPPGFWHPGDMLVVPMYRDEQIVGLISVDDPEDGLLPDLNTIQALEIFADQAALALANAQRFEAMEERNRDLDAFAYSISHDLKTPLTTVRGYAEALLMLFDERMSAEERELAQRILDGADRMAAMVNDMLLLSRASRITEPPEVVNTYEAVQAAIQRLLEVAIERGVQIEVSPELPAVHGYRTWVEQIFANLIDNAIKYIGRDNPNPRIVIGGRQEEGMAHLWVQDNGLGLTPEQLARLFEMFTRFHRDEGEGTGLGLTIVKRAVESMEGRIWAESPGPGAGTTFHILLPAA